MAAPVRPEPPARFGPWRREVRSLLELIALTGLVFVQPTFDVLSKNATIFVTHDTTPLEAIVFVLVVVALPPLVAWAAEVLVGLVRPSARGPFHAVLLALLVGVFAAEVVARASDLSRAASIAVAVPAAVLGGLVIARFGPARDWLRYLAFATPVFVILFLGFSPVSEAVFSEGPTSAADVRIRNDARVVMVVLDELPEVSLLDGSGHVDAELFPNFAALSGDATWYRNTTTVAGYTQVAVPAILTGDYPAEVHPVETAATFPHNLFTLLGGAYDLNVSETVTRLCPKAFCEQRETAEVGTRSGVRGLLDDAWTAWNRFAWPDRSKGTVSFAEAPTESSDHALRTGDEFVRSLKPGRAARLDFLHVLLPHQAWHYLPTGQDYEEGAARGAPYYSWATDDVARTARLRHLLQLQATDRLLGRIMERLRELGVYDRSLVVVTADHGVAFDAGEAVRGISEGAYEQVAWTPLFIKAPGQAKGRIDDQPVQSIDVLPTIADHLDADLPWDVDGRSVLGVRRPQGTRPFYRSSLNVIDPEPGTDFAPLDGGEGFARVVRGRAAPPGDDPDLRLFRSGPSGALVGTEAAPRVAGAAQVLGRVEDAGKYRDVDLDAHEATWAYLFGTVRAPAGTRVAVAVNGRLAGFTSTYDRGVDPTTPFWVVLPPKLMRQGRNQIDVYAVSGPAADPVLTPVELGARG